MKKHTLLKKIFFCVLYFLCFSVTHAQDATEYYNRGVTSYGQQQYDLAITNFTNSIRLSPNYVDAYVYRGLTYYYKQNYPMAVQDYSSAINLNPNYQLAYFNRGLTYYTQGNYQLSIADFTKSINLNPSYTSAYLSRGNAYYATLQYDLAIQDYAKSINASPNDSYGYIVRGLSYFGKKEYDRSIQDYNTALGITPNSVDAYYDRGSSYFAKGSYDLAISDFSKAININPNYVTAYTARGAAYFYKGEYDLALQDYNKAVVIGPNDPYAYYNRGFAYFLKKDYDLAIQDYSKAINLNPSYLDAYNARGLTYKSKGAYDLAINDYMRTIAIDANYSKAFVNIIEPLARQYRFAEVAKYYNDFRARNIVEYIDDESYKFYKKYIETITQYLTANNYTMALMNITEAEKLYNNKEQAKDEYQKSSFSAILALKGYVLEKLDRPAEAKQAYDQALLLNTQQPDVTAALIKLAQKQQILVKTDETPPTISIIEPAAKRSFTIEDDKSVGTQRIRGKALDEGGIKKLTVNNVPLKIEEGGYFETTVNIKEGVNVFTIVAMDNNANSASENVVVEGGKATNKPQPPPIGKLDIPVLNNTSVYHAVLIAETDYTDSGIKDLPGTLSDMRKMYKVLTSNYNFGVANVDTLVNATKVNILENLIQKANAMKEGDNLFVFYAGHGQMIKHEDNSEEGFLVPVDAGKNKMSSYISSDDLVRTIKYSKAKHILFVADACFAGSLFRDISSDAPEPVAEAYKDKSRKVLASGNRQAVPDQSEFIEYLRLALQENKEKYITAEQLIDSFKNQYKTTTHLQLQYYPIKNVDDLGGQFVFIRK
ncbi:MAG: tetratricopeptide repeat protein [Bacteroidota bacterium]